jgi:hypothetical protein
MRTMIKLNEKEETDFEQDLYEAQVEEALAKWDAAKLFTVEDRNFISKEKPKEI